ncbi:uncharacterized protein LOC132546303 [Ylistrum balloti]|uniref:uncharacterized protein LOC132546303 n=1 Tax=Ylistrum balloti TaxID=509963 RepID=UPI0029058FD9|nr:uncharacterized protein LOC132546303 [Ylistrum balloti]
MMSDGLSKRKDENDGTCTICTEVYRDPRLLPCRHTFCSGCLERWHISSCQRHYFSCPICREKVWLPHVGVQGFRSNYFVPCQLDKKNCSVCKTSKFDVRRCNFCDQLFCRTCRTEHESKQVGQDDQCCCSQEDELVQEEDTAVRTAISALRAVTRSCCYAEIIGGFQCSAGGSSTQVTKIVPVSASEAWVLFDNGPVIYRYSMTGTVTEMRYAVGKVIDMCIHPDGPLLVIEEFSSSVLVCGDEHTDPIEYVIVNNYILTSLLVRDEGSMIVAARSVDESLFRRCYLIDFDRERKRLSTRIVQGEFIQISGLAFDVFSNRMCTADMECRVVHVLPDDDRVLTYRRSPAFPNRNGSGGLSKTQFAPRAVCSGLHNAFLVLDCGSGYIHVLSTSARLTNVVVMDDQENIGSPSTIAVGRDDQLWVGDGSNGMVKVYSLKTFINHLEPVTFEHGMPINNRDFFDTAELFSATSSVPENIPSRNTTLSDDILALCMDGNVSAIRTIVANGDICIILEDTGNPESNAKMRDRVQRMIHWNEVLRSHLIKAGCNPDDLGTINIKFDSAPSVRTRHIPSNHNPSGNFPRTSGNRTSQPHPVPFLTGNRDVDMKFLDNFLRINPSIREDMEKKGITPGMIVDFPSFLNGRLV